MSNQTHVTSAGWSRKMNSLIRAIGPLIIKTTNEQSDFVLKKTIENVSGPGIGERPDPNNPAIGEMPVPTRSGQLRRAIKRTVIYKWLHAVFADLTIAAHAWWAHQGTRRTKPRRYLADVLTMYSRKIYSEMNSTIKKGIQRIGRK